MNSAAASVKSPRKVPKSLRYVSDQQPGIRRLRRRSSFTYLGVKGRPLADPHVLARIRKLAIPPAYEDVWICPLPDGHLQATGRDARGRKQYRYHPDWRSFREQRKFERLSDFGKALPKLRRRLEKILATSGLTREKVLAAVVSLIDRTLIRVGNEEYARSNSSYGLTTLRVRHARVSASRLTLKFRGKSGQPQHIVLSDARLARIVRRCQELPGQLLFQYIDETGAAKPLRSDDVNDFLREAMGLDVSARTFRTWGATVHLARIWTQRSSEEAPLAPRARMLASIADVAQRLGNTPSVCRNSYLDPRLSVALEDGSWAAAADATPKIRGLSAEESAVLGFLKRR